MILKMDRKLGPARACLRVKSSYSLTGMQEGLTLSQTTLLSGLTF